MEAGTHIVSLDLGFAGEPTALAVTAPSSRIFFADPRESDLAWENSFETRHLERFPVGDSYRKVASRTKELISDRKRLPRSVVLINTSSSGAEPLKVFRDEGIHARAFTILNGEASVWQGQTQGVSKRAVIGATVLLLQDGRLAIAEKLKLASSLVSELTAFKMKPATKTDPIEAMREGQHGDLVFAVSLACWWGYSLVWDDQTYDAMLPDDGDFALSEASEVTGY